MPRVSTGTASFTAAEKPRPTQTVIPARVPTPRGQYTPQPQPVPRITPVVVVPKAATSAAPTLSQIIAQLHGQPLSAAAVAAQPLQEAAAATVAATATAAAAPLTAAESKTAAEAGAAAAAQAVKQAAAKPQPTPSGGQPATIPRGTLDHSELETVWLIAGGVETEQDVAAAVAQAESGGDPTSIDNTAHPDRPHYHRPGPGAQPEYSIGLWQINMLAHPQYTERELLTPLGNARAAVQVSSDGRDWHPWSTFNDGAYREFLAGFNPSPVGTGTAGGVSGRPTTPRPAGVQAAWADLIGFYGRTVPDRHSEVRSLSGQLVNIFR